MTYKFKNDNYYKRFQLPELKKWGTKIASIVENVQRVKVQYLFMLHTFRLV